MSRRDTMFERDFVASAAREAGVGGMHFDELIMARLDRGTELFEDAFLDFSLRRFVREIGEEGEDVAAWSVGAAQCKALAELDPARREEVMHWLHALVGLGARVEWAKRQLASLID